MKTALLAFSFLLLPYRCLASERVTFPDGAVAIAERECGVTDLCATILFPNGDDVRIYNSGAGHCEPYSLRVVREHADAVISESELGTEQGGPRRCKHFKNSAYTFDNGSIRMSVSVAKDGALFVQFTNP